MNPSRLLLLAILGSACSSKDGPPAESASADQSEPTSQASAGDDLAEVANYRLTMTNMDKYYATQRNIMLKVKDMTPAEREAMNVGNSGDATLDVMTQRMEQHPAYRSALRDAGMSARQFATHTVAMMQSAMAAGVLQMRPNDNQDSLAREMKASMENIKFFRENEAELTRKQKALEADIRKMEGSEGS